MKKISRRILTLLMAVIMVAATFVPAFAETAEVDDGHDHEQTACAHEHHEQDGEAVESTCTAFGYTRYHCLDCGEYYLSDFKPLKEHEYEVVVVEAANCQQKQITEEQCKNCGAVKPDSRKEGENGDHVWEIITPATCTTAGERKCTVCEKVEEIPAGDGHSFVITDATCTTDGSKVCEKCGYTEVILATGHEFEADRANAVLPTNCKPGKMPYKCKNCDASYDVVIEPEAEHGEEEIVPAVAATCTSVGWTEGKKCKVCGEYTVKPEELPMLEHTPMEIPAVAPTCHSTGLTAGEKCSVCETILVEQEEVEMIPHTWDEGTVTVPATCTTSGKKVFKCTADGCDATKEEIIPEIDGHDFAETVYEPTCTQYGYTLKFCRTCGYQEKSEMRDPLGHNKVFDPAVPATCQYAGIKEGSWHCDRCDYKEEIAEPKLEHKWDEGVVTKEATCTEDGSVLYTCTTCSAAVGAVATKTETVKALGHDEIAVVIPATCKTEGYTYTGCSRCDYDKGDRYDITPVDPDAHVLVTEVVIREATCTTEGESLSYCKLCDKKDIRTYPPKNDNHEWNVTTEPTCITKGERECTRCHKKEEIAASGHTAGAEATCTDAQICTVCHAVIVPALGHDWKTVKEIKAPTCTEEGKAEQICTRCKLEQTNAIPATGHKWDDGEVTVEPTCTTVGTKVFKCTVEGCNGTKNEEIAALGHDWAGEWLTGVKATCAAEGSEYRKCARCEAEGTASDGDQAYRVTAKDPRNHTPERDGEGKIIIKDVLRKATCAEAPAYSCVCADCGELFALIGDENEKLPHTFGEWTIVKGATCTEAGLRTHECEICGYVGEEDIPATGHNLTHFDAVDATCTEEGNVEYWTCSNDCCKDKFFGADKKEIEDIKVAKKAHNLTKVDANDATCTAEGNIAYWTCADCGKFFKDEKATEEIEEADTVLAKAEHTFKPATCTEPATCEKCGYEDGDALGHDYVEHDVTDPTCVGTGLKAHYTCSRCNAIFDEQKNATTLEDLKIPATGHTVETVIVEADCVNYGFEYHYCTVCAEVLKFAEDPSEINIWDLDCNGKYGISIDHFIAALGHDFTENKVVEEATCTTDGVSGKACSRCGELKRDENGELVDATVLPKIGHKNADGIVLVDGWTCKDVAAVMTVDNIDNFDNKCANCGEEITFTHVDLTNETVYAGKCADEADPNSGYDYVIERCSGCNKNSAKVLGRNVHHYVEKTNAPTCKEAGKSWKECDTVIHISETETKVCGDVIDETELAIDENAHAWKEIDPTAATCESDKIRHFVCEYDETHTKDETVADTKLEHEEIFAPQLSTPATYTKDGENVYICKLCEKVLRKETVPMLTGLKVSYNVTNPKGGAFVNSGYVDLEIKFDASNLQVAVLQLDFAYDTNVLELVDPDGNDVAFTAGEGANAFDHTRVTSVDAKDGVCKIGSYMSKGSATIDGEGIVYAVIHFRVLPTAYVNGDRLSTTIRPTDLICETVDGEAVTAVNGNAQTFNIVKLGDMTGDGKLNISDIRLINDIINANSGAEEPKYVAEADINKDGVINYLDLELLESAIFQDSTYDEVVSK